MDNWPLFTYYTNNGETKVSVDKDDLMKHTKRELVSELLQMYDKLSRLQQEQKNAVHGLAEAKSTNKNLKDKLVVLEERFMQLTADLNRALGYIDRVNEDAQIKLDEAARFDQFGNKVVSRIGPYLSSR